MKDARYPPADDGDPNIADAASLFHDTPAPAQRVPTPAPAPIDVDARDDYAVEDLPDDIPARPISIPVERPRPVKTPKKVETFEDPHPVRPEPSAVVEEVWTRGAEWGGTFALLGLFALVELGLLFFLFSNEMFTPAFMVLLLGVPAFVVVAYPILITLERPVRITPEQAVNDFYAALAHHAPHYRRMWLLLSSAGRVSGSYASFDGFRAYWKRRLTELRGKDSKGFTPLKFQIVDFRSEKSAGLSKIDATYVVNVFVRGQQESGPIGSHKVSMSLVKGPDRMWYLNKGTLP